MAAEITLEDFETHLTNLKKEDLQKKMDIASNIGKQCDFKVPKHSDPLSKCHKLTGVPTSTLSAVQTLNHKAIKFEEWLKDQKRAIPRYNFGYTSLRKLILKKYTQLLEIPTGIRENKDYEGYTTFFTTAQLPGTRASILVEKPETFMERHRFLYTKMMYGELKKTVVYIGKINLILINGKFIYNEDSVEAKNRLIIAASPTFGHLGYIYSCGTTIEEYMINWLDEKIIPQLPNESVIVFQENVLNNIDDYGINDLSKEKIINWLNTNKIDHDPETHRAELYKLAQTFKKDRREELSPAELSFRSKEHITIRKKRCNLNNNFFDPFWDKLIHDLNASAPVTKTLIKSNANSITNAVDVTIENLPLAYWNNLGNILLDKERDIYREDLEMEHVIDKLMTMVKNEGLPKEWETKLDDYNKTVDHKYIILSDTLKIMYENMHKNQYYKTLNIFK